MAGGNQLSVRDVASRFESLGGGVCRPKPPAYGCEFGFFQRRARFESIGLLRWASIPPRGLITGLTNSFSEIDDIGKIIMRKDGPTDWNAMQTAYGIYMAHTGLSYDRHTAEDASRKFCKTLAYLRTKLVEDLGNAEKIFVYRTSDEAMPDAEIMELFHALQVHGPNILLYVKLAGEESPFTVCELTKNLLIGTIDRFAMINDPAGNNDEGWEKVCREALSLINNRNTVQAQTFETMIDLRIEAVLRRHSLLPGKKDSA